MIKNLPKEPKRPVSVLVLLHDNNGNVLLLERADRQGFWQSVTGSLEMGEIPFQAALREVKEETGIVLTSSQLYDWHYQTVYEIYEHWRYRYATGVTHNTEHWFSALISQSDRIKLAENEHVAFEWLPAKEASEKVFSPSNRDIILQWQKKQV